MLCDSWSSGKMIMLCKFSHSTIEYNKVLDLPWAVPGMPGPAATYD